MMTSKIKNEPPSCKQETIKDIETQHNRLFEKVDREWVGRVPTRVSREFLSLNFRQNNPVKAIREKCLDCCGGSKAEIRKCVSTDCAIWPFRMGTNPFRKKAVLTAEEKKRRAQRLRSGSISVTQPEPNTESP